MRKTKTIRSISSNTLTFILLIFCPALLVSAWAQGSDTQQAQKLMSYIEALAGDSGIGPRVAGSAEEKAAALWISDTFKALEIPVELQEFERIFSDRDVAQQSQNVIARLEGKSNDTFIIGAHYDSVPASTDSLGVIDNAASVALMIALAEHLQSLPELATNVVFVAFGAEEVGLNGAKHFVESLSASNATVSSTTGDNVIGMINLDSITGGDYQYIHSANSAGYACEGNADNFNANAIWRDQLLTLSHTLELEFKKHSGNKDFAAGETGDWSDHTPFSCAGIPIVHLEATNFDIVGQGGQDGYSQTINPAMWTCFDENGLTACNRATEEKWGQIWHTEFDRIDVLNKEFPGRLNKQLHNVYALLTAFFEQLN